MLVKIGETGNMYVGRKMVKNYEKYTKLVCFVLPIYNWIKRARKSNRSKNMV